MKLNEQIYTDGLVKTAVMNGGFVRPLIWDINPNDGVAIMNPSIANIGGELVVNLRITNYTLWHSEDLKYPQFYGPLQYIHPVHQPVLATQNYMGLLDDNFCVKYAHKIEMTYDVPPIWEFHGLEDGRIVVWDNKLYLTGVRRDNNPTGIGRMELSEINWNGGKPYEVSRMRVPTDGDDLSYCEKNWMPIIDRDYTYLKWSNPVQLATFDPLTKTTRELHKEVNVNFRDTIRGGTQVIKFNNKYFCIGHTVSLWKPVYGNKDAIYNQQLVILDENLNLEYISDDFKYMNGQIEFTNGICLWGDYILITFAYVDNASYVVGIKPETLFVD